MRRFAFVSFVLAASLPAFFAVLFIAQTQPGGWAGAAWVLVGYAAVVFGYALALRALWRWWFGPIPEPGRRELEVGAIVDRTRIILTVGIPVALLIAWAVAHTLS